LPTFIALVPAIAPAIPLCIRDTALDLEFTVRAQNCHATVKPIDIRNATFAPQVKASSDYVKTCALAQMRHEDVDAVLLVHIVGGGDGILHRLQPFSK
jgi:hypothetical protein